MIGWLKAIGDWFSGKKRVKALEQQLMAAVQAPGAPPELVEQATLYFSGKPKSDPALPKVVKEDSNGSR